MSIAPFVSMEEIESMARRIAEKYDPEKIILFGSYARGTPRPYSDIDLLVILPFEGSSVRKSVEILTHLDIHYPIDLLAREPEDTEWRLRAGDPLLKDAFREGRTLYERPRTAH